MNLKKLAKSYGEPLYLIAYGSFLVLKILLTSNYSNLVSGLIYDLAYSATLSMFVISLVCNLYLGGRSSFPGFIVFVLGVVSVIVFCGGAYLDNPLVYALLIFYIGKDFDYKKMIYITIILTSVLVIFINISSHIGIISDTTVEDPFRDTRYSLGFRWILYSPTYVFNVTALYIYLKKKHIKWWVLTLLMAVNIYNYIFTQSRLTFVFTIFIIGIGIFLKFFPGFPEKKRVLHYLAVALYPLCAIITFVLTFLLSQNVSWVVSLNASIEYRLTDILEVFSKIGVSFIGRADRVYFIDNGLDPSLNIYIDNLYGQIVLLQGLIIAAVLLIIHIKAVYNSWRRKDYYLEIILCMLALHGLFDDLIYMIWYNTFWVFALSIVFIKKKNIARSETSDA